MMRSALGDATKVADYDTVKKRLLGSRYTMDFSSGVNFNLDVISVRLDHSSDHVLPRQGGNAV